MKSLLNKTKGLVAAATLALLMGGIGQAEAVTINFNDAPVGNLTSFYASQGVTFSNAQVFDATGLCGISVCGAWTPPQALAAPGPIAGGSPTFNPFPLSPIVATFSSAVDFVSIFAADVALDGASLVAYDAGVGGNVGGSQTIVSPVEIAQTLAVAGSSIFRIEMFQPNENSQLPFGDGMDWDNLTFNVQDTNPNPVPEPSTMFLLRSGLAGIFGWQLRKQKQQA
jgi:hypothetical protein